MSLSCKLHQEKHLQPIAVNVKITSFKTNNSNF